MNEQPLVSVILPVYNGEAWLERSLGSLRAQTYPNFECVMVNDGSTDGSRAICAALAEQDPRFRLLDKENGGVSSARNAALAQLRGEWFTFCDQDDAMDPHSLEYAVAMQTAHPDRLVMWGPGTRPILPPRLQNRWSSSSPTGIPCCAAIPAAPSL